MREKLISLIIGYLFGSLLTAEIIARKYVGKPAAQVGETGNPGMANIMASLGFVPGILTLAGDLLKVILAGTICHVVFPDAGRMMRPEDEISRQAKEAFNQHFEYALEHYVGVSR